MLQTNEIYLNGNNSTVQIASAHETSKIMVYEHPLFGKVRIFTENGKTWFNGTDIAISLKYENPQKAIRDHCKDHGITIRSGVVKTGMKKNGTAYNQIGNMKFISEGNIYRLIVKSHMPKADEFESWIFDDVIPSVINTGNYSIQPQHNIPQTYSDALLLAANQARQIENLKEENHLLVLENNSYREKVEFADSIMQSKNCITIGEMANILNQNKIFRKGRNALYGALRQKGYLLKRGIRYNLPTQKSISEGIMRVAEIPSHTISGITINRSAVITPKGQQYFIKMFRKLKGDKQFSLSF